MVALIVAATVLLQGGRPSVDATVSRSRLTVGEELVYTVTAVSPSAVPMQVTVSSPAGLAVLTRSERTEVAYAGGPARATTIEIRFRALQAGRWQLGPTRARQGWEEAVAPPIVVEVEEDPGAAVTLNPEVRRLLERAAPPGGEEVGLALLLSADTARVGEQVDVVTAAWFLRDLRLQLRRAPTLQPPVLDGVWTYPQPTPAGIAASRQFNGRTYDLFVVHQVVFPLVPGIIDVPRATIKYSVPLTLQFFSQEDRFAVTSNAARLTILPLPSDGQPADFAGAIGRDLRIERTVTPPAARIGEAVTVDVAVTGEGNIALWPAPEVRWPEGVRAYPDRTDERIQSPNGRLGGVKTFRYLAVPQSGAPVVLPAVRYPYYELASGAYAVARAGAAPIAVVSGGEAASARALPPALLRPADAPLAWRVTHSLPAWGWLLLLAIPPAAWLARRWPKGWRLPGGQRRRAKQHGGGEALHATLRALVPDPAKRDTAGLTAALRAAGIDPVVAGRTVAVRQQLLARRYGPGPSRDTDAALEQEAASLARRLGLVVGSRMRSTTAALTLLLFTSHLGAQNPSPERLYETGALRAAIDAFALRTAAAPAVPAHWYNLGAARYRLGEDAAAAAAWLHARREAPRNTTIRRALRLTPPPDDVSARWLWTPPLTVDELGLLAAVVWVGGWALLASGRRRMAGCAAIGAALVLGSAALGLRRWYERPIGIALGAEPLRVSPHGRAESVAPLETGAAVTVIRQEGNWLLVRGPSATGWLPQAAVVRLTSGPTAERSR